MRALAVLEALAAQVESRTEAQFHRDHSCSIRCSFTGGDALIVPLRSLALTVSFCETKS